MTTQTQSCHIQDKWAEKPYNRQIERYLKENDCFIKHYSNRLDLSMKAKDGFCFMVLVCDGKDACLSSSRVPEDKIARMINRYDCIAYSLLDGLSLNKLRNKVCGWLERFGCNYAHGRPYLLWPASKEVLDQVIVYENEV